MKVTIEISDETKARVDKLIKEGKYKDLKDFAKKAADMMLLAEEQAKLFKLGV